MLTALVFLSGRLIEINYFDPADLVNPVKEVDFTYDDVGNLLTYDDGITSGNYVYDDGYRKVTETVDYGDFSKAFSYTYYSNGLKGSFTGPDGVTYSYTYDANNQLAGIQIPGQGSITYTEYNWNRPTNITLPGGSTKSYTYDPLMRVTNITTKDPGQNILLNYNYEYDKMDNIVSKVTEHGTYEYDYDDLYRLTGSSCDLIAGSSSNEAFTYDAVGNRLTSLDTTESWSYNTNNELQTTDNTQYVYDDNGNMVQKTEDGVVTYYIYNIEDRLTEVRDDSGSLIAEYYYDPFGRRLWKDVDGTKTCFLYADEGLIGEYDGTGAEIKAYGYKPNSTWTTDPLFMKIGVSYYFYHNDHLGTPQKMTSVNGAVVWSAKYEAFGKAEVSITSTVTNNLRFPGQYEDQETGLHYNWLRFYNSSIGRYLKEDPIGINGGINYYAFVYSNPINYGDPFGLFCCNEDGTINTDETCCENRSASEKAGAWAQYQYEQDSKDYTLASDSCGGSGKWKCNCFVRDALQIGAGLKGKEQVPKHYIEGEKQWTFAKANELADLTKNTDVLGVGEGSIGDIVAWASNRGSGHSGIVGCDKKIYSAGEFEIYRWNNTTWFSLEQIRRYVLTGRTKIYRNLLTQ